MQVTHPRCAGLDVHQKTVVVTATMTQEDGTVSRERQIFSTMTTDLLTQHEWLQQWQIEVVALESTGIYLHLVRKEQNRTTRKGKASGLVSNQLSTAQIKANGTGADWPLQRIEGIQ